MSWNLSWALMNFSLFIKLELERQKSSYILDVLVPKLESNLLQAFSSHLHSLLLTPCNAFICQGSLILKSEVNAEPLTSKGPHGI